MSEPKTRILLIAPLVDKNTIVSNLGIYDILKYADTKWNVDIDYLPGIMANKFMYNLYLKFKKYDLIVYYGHGESNKLFGNHLWMSMINKQNIKKSKETPFDVMACYSAKELGQYAIQHGAKAYIGTTEPYYSAFPEKERDYLEDWIDYTTARTKALMDGRTFGQAHNSFREKLKAYIEIYRQNKGYRNYDWYYDSALKNLQNTVLLGDRNATIFD